MYLLVFILPLTAVRVPTPSQHTQPQNITLVTHRFSLRIAVLAHTVGFVFLPRPSSKHNSSFFLLIPGFITEDYVFFQFSAFVHPFFSLQHHTLFFLLDFDMVVVFDGCLRLNLLSNNLRLIVLVGRGVSI